MIQQFLLKTNNDDNKMNKAEVIILILKDDLGLDIVINILVYQQIRIKLQNHRDATQGNNDSDEEDSQIENSKGEARKKLNWHTQICF